MTALCTITAQSGDITLSSGTVTGSGSFAVICPQISDAGVRYQICSNVMYTAEHDETTDTNAESGNGGSSTLAAILTSAAVAVLAGGLIVLGILNRKKKKAKAE